MNAGKKGKTTVFLITDTQIKDEKFLEDVDGLLNAGEVPNLFAIDEKQDIIEVPSINPCPMQFVAEVCLGDASISSSREH